MSSTSKRGSAFSGSISISESGTAAKPIRLTSYGSGPLPKFTNPTTRDDDGNALIVGGDYIIVENLHFHDTPGEHVSGMIIMTRLAALRIKEGANHCIIRENEFINTGQGIMSAGEHTLITENYLDGPNYALWRTSKSSWGPMGIHLNIGNQESRTTQLRTLGRKTAHGVLTAALSKLIAEDIIKRISTFTIIIRRAMLDSLNPAGTTIGRDIGRKSTTGECPLMFATTGSHGCSCWLPAPVSISITIRLRGTIHWEVPRCRVRIDVRGGMPVGEPSGAHFRNNLFIYSSSPFSGNRAGGAIKTANWYSKYKSPGTQYQGDSSQAGSGDPCLVDLQQQDYHLKVDSPLRGKAINLSQFYKSDFDGLPLPKTGNWDIGAIQYNATRPKKRLQPKDRQGDR